MNNTIELCADILASASSVICLTGAGISVDSGIPPFRGHGSIWEKIDPIEFAHIRSFMKNPERVWQGFLVGMKDLLDKARPNDGHTGLVELERAGCLNTIITQNIDGLHQEAGSSDVIEFHGTFAWQRCMDCNRRIPSREMDLSTLPPRCSCGGILRPDCVFFGEAIPEDSLFRSQYLAETCDVMLVVGTSAVVQPAAMIPIIAKKKGAVIIEINPEPTPLNTRISDHTLRNPAGKALKDLVRALKQRIH
jgi:NAD-dependent deacetylase